MSAGSEENQDWSGDDLEADEMDSASDQAEALDLTIDERKLVTQPYDLGVKSISTDIAQGRISLTIEYQRKYVWDAGKASRLIESLLLNVPIPVCYFAENEDGVYEVIDGLQRLTTIKNYLENDFPLTGISVLSELEGKRFEDLAPRDQRRFENRTLRCVVITEDSHPDIKFDVFERLNTGAASLTAQELRNSVYRGSFNDSLKQLAEEEYFTRLIGNFSNKRMDLEEMILRFFALAGGLEQYKPPLRQFLNTHMRANRHSLPDAQEIARFRQSCELVFEILGDLPFRISSSRTPLNKALFDAIMIPFAFADRTRLRESAPEVKKMLGELVEDDVFRAAIGRATADKQRMQYRIQEVARRLTSIGVTVELPGGSSIVSVDL